MRTTISTRSRWATALGLSALAACARPAAAPPTAGEPVLRVALVTGVAEVVIGAEGSAVGTAGGTPALPIASGGQVTLRADGNAVRLGLGGDRFSRLTFASTAAGRRVRLGTAAYRGTLEVYAGADGLIVVNVVGLEDYLQGVVNAELGPRPAGDLAAVEAQAIVSRTYALRNRGRFQAEGFDLRAGASDQVYRGVGGETPVGTDAVRRTAGQVLTWHGDLIVVFFHSTCGGLTAEPEEAFVSVRGMPYLKPVSDARPGGSYCDISPRFRWRVEWEGDQLRDILRRTLPAAIGVEASTIDRVRDVAVRRVGASGRADDVWVTVGSGAVPVPGYAVRAVFATPEGAPLGSAAVRFTAERAGDTVAHLTAEGRGWGHGVGLCQWGAIGRARAGQDAATILATYFPGSRLARWY